MTLTRRACLAALLAGTAARPARGDEARDPEQDAADSREAHAVMAAAAEAGLGTLRASRTRHYLAIGNAPDAYRSRAVRTCEALLAEYVDHFGRRGFPARVPEGRLTIVTLVDADSYRKFMGAAYEATDYGSYNPRTNRVVVFDPGPKARRSENLAQVVPRNVAHEGVHQLTYNTGLFDRASDIPRCIGEGLAMYGEVRKPDGRGAIGQMHAYYLNLIWERIHRGSAWLPTARMIADDETFRSVAVGERALHAYIQGWLLVHYLMTTPAMLPRFRAYLAAIRLRRDDEHRREDAETYLGRLDRLHEEVLRHARRIASR